MWRPMNIYENISSEFFLECELFPVNIAQKIKARFMDNNIFCENSVPYALRSALSHSRIYAQLGTAPVVRY